jgi:hypothetical protein
MEYSQVVRHSFLVRVFKGSNPFIPIKKSKQLVTKKLVSIKLYRKDLNELLSFS